MRPVLAAAATTVLPMVVGHRWVAGWWVLRWSLGAAVGIVFLALGALIGGLLGAPLAGAAAALAVAWVLGPRLRWDAGGPPLDPMVRRVVVLVAVVGVVLLAMSVLRPVASWDGWFQWSIKSKALATAGTFSSPVFLDPLYAWVSQDFPTLLPSWQAVAYVVSGDLTVSWPLQFQQAWLWTVGGIGLVTLAARHGRWACLLPLAWLITPQVVWQSMQSYADVPMALWLLLGVAVLWSGLDDRRAHVLAGVLLAGAALTKTEGFPLVVAVLLFVLVRRQPRWMYLTAPAIVVLARVPWWLFTSANDLSNHMVNAGSFVGDILAQVPGRLPVIAAIMVPEMFSPMRWGLLVPACLATLVLYRRGALRLGGATLLQLAIFVGVYAVWPYRSWPLEQYMTVNVDRVLIVPLGMLALTAALRPRGPLSLGARGGGSSPSEQEAAPGDAAGAPAPGPESEGPPDRASVGAPTGG